LTSSPVVANGVFCAVKVTPEESTDRLIAISQRPAYQETAMLCGKRYRFVTAMFVVATLFTPVVARAAPIISANVGLASPDVLLTFDEVALPTNTPVGAAYSAYGVTFTGAFYDSSCCIETWVPDGASPYLGNVTTNTSTFTDWAVTFSSPVNAASFTMAANAQTFTLTALLGGLVIESLIATISSSDDWGYYGFSGIVFDELRMDANQAQLFDRLQWNAAVEVPAVPEPASLLLFGTGAATLAAKARRRKKQQIQ
jgi:hypothetical protein